MTRLLVVAGLLMLTLLSSSRCLAMEEDTKDFRFSGEGAQAILAHEKPDPDFPSLSRNASEAVDLLGLRQTLLDIKKNESVPSLEISIKKQELINKMLVMSVEVQAVMSEIDGEVARTNGYQQVLEQRRDKFVRNTNIATFMSSGALGAIGSSLAIPAGGIGTVAPNATLVAGSGVAITLPMYQLYKVDKLDSQLFGNPTMLAGLYDRPVDFRTRFPDNIWCYLNSPAPWAPDYTRKEFLLGRWSKLGHVPRHSGKYDQKKLDAVCGSLEGTQKLTYQDMLDQISMLVDLRAIVAMMNQNIVEILHLVQK